ncbi:cytochrome P450 6B6-like [Hyposmocoma kahamanoa]|uniref:cytochrome P450 6B6-like n=1 Tax=Hyposmocoma kahamanoa TaxID=1477025 RepID=UPI000E6D7B48|nr:cytochrome P450 6B6-like [Hyposmocoma kahamanoa]XP_026328268.1 cytochrome P450 6B6-like [Hyposmocoma kahamanoa]
MIALTLVVVILVVFYYYNTRTFKYWHERGIKHDKPIPMFGNNLQNYLMQKSVTQVAVDMYWKYSSEKVVGFFRSTRPELVIRDPEIAKRILTIDFPFFYPRGLNPHKTVIEPLLRNLFFADGDLWRLLRQRMTPAFTTAKLKAMFPLISSRAERLRATITAAAEGNSRVLDARDIMARYTTDLIGSIGFGLDTDSFSTENSAFRKLGYDIFNVTVPEFIIGVLKEIFPEATKHLHYMFKTEKELINLVNEIQRQRNYEPSGRNDFIDLLLELKKKGTIVGESIERTKPDGTSEQASLEMDAELIAAQVFVFFAAGFETSSSATSFTLHQLAFHPEVQKKVQNEIDQVLTQHNNELSYDAVKEMKYLEWTFYEGMRLFPSLGFLIRESAKKYTIPEINVTIDEGIGIIIPLQALHNDPQYFEKPEQFRPERFHPDEFDCKDKKFVYLPFGEGPRACIGARLGLMQSIAGLAAILSRFTVEPAPTTLRFPMIEPKSSIVQSIRGGLPLIFRKR